MKSETINAVLTYVLGALVVLTVIFALQTIIRSREVRRLQAQTLVCRENLNRLNLLLNETLQYGKTHPDILPVIRPFESKRPAR